MKKNSMIIAMLCVSLLFIVSCQKRVAAQGQDVKPVAIAKVAPAPAPVPMVGVVDFMSHKIYFDFDKSTLTKESQDILAKKVPWLNSNLAAQLLIEGHCDERGTAEYNLALGDRRANAAKKFLVDAGISDKRIKTISYGEEKPVCKQHNEECWKANRNDAFVVTK